MTFLIGFLSGAVTVSLAVFIWLAVLWVDHETLQEKKYRKIYDERERYMRECGE